MIRNPSPNGTKPAPGSGPLPQLNPEIAKWFQDREGRRKVVLTTTTPRGQTLDWIPIESQVQDGKIATPPPPPHILPPDNLSRAAEFELENPNAQRGPAGTVPVVRKNLAALHETTTLPEYLSKRGGLKVNGQRVKGLADPNPKGYFHATSGQKTSLLGCSTWLNIWDPYVETSSDHSLMQCGLQNYDNPQLQSLEGGWTVDQGLNGDWQPHLFVYYTTNGYSQDGDNLGGYNQDVDGWVQYSSVIYPGAGWSPLSSQGGGQYGFTFLYQLYENNWWVWVQGATGQWVGYYPSWLFFGGPGKSEFSTLGAVAEWVGFWGEVYSALSNPNLTTDQMGSGRKAEAGFSHACFQKNLLILTSGSWVNHNGSSSSEDPSKFDIQLHMNSDGPFGSYFYAGGPDATVLAGTRSPLDGYQTDFNNQQHVNYIGTDNHVRELYYTDHWGVNDLTVAAGALNYLPKPGSAIDGYETGFNNQQHVNYIGTDGHVHELYYTDHWSHNDLTVAAGAQNYLPRPGSAIDGYETTFNNQQHVNYMGTDGHVHELYYTDHWSHNDLTVAAAAQNYLPASDSAIDGYETTFKSQQHVNYMGTDGHVHELYYTDHWSHNDLTVAAAAQNYLPRPGTAIDGYETTFNNQQHVNYIGTDGHVHELYYTDHWSYNDLTVAAAAQSYLPKSGSPVDGYETVFNNQQHVNYIGSDGHVHELFYTDHWSHNDLTVAAGAQNSLPASGSRIDGYETTFNNQQHVNYIGSNGDVHELVYTDHWSHNDLTQIFS